MQTYRLLVQNRAVTANSADTTLVRTSVGIDQIQVLFDDAEWLGFPVTVTFSQGGDLVTAPLELTPIDGSDEWAAEAAVTVPYEVIDATGPIRVTFQGTDSDNRHIITARSSPISVEEAGDVEIGPGPSDYVTRDQWLEAYAKAMQVAERDVPDMVAAAEAQILAYLRDRIAEITAEVATADSVGTVRPDGTTITIDPDGTIHGPSEQVVKTATTDRLGVVRPDGTTITVDRDGTIHGAQTYELPVATASTLGGIRPDGTTITVDADGTAHGTQEYVLPVASTSTLGGVKPDGTTITADGDGTIHGARAYELPAATQSVLGGVKPDGTTIAADQDGTIHVVGGTSPTGPHWEVRTDAQGSRRLAIVIPKGD